MPQLNVTQMRAGYSPSPDYTGQTIDGRYRIEDKLGSGGMGDVYRARRLLMGDTVAMKILHAHLARDPQAAERFRREAATATKLRHKNVVGIYDVGMSVTHHVPYILMELAEGYTLRQLIQQHRIMPLDFAVTVTTQVCAALDEAHGLGIIHRDIKPENIVAHQTANGWHIKILDFGISKLYNHADIGLTQDGNAMGTPRYMSPEQCLGEDLDARSDIYSVGIMLYEMLAGTVPFKAAAASAVAVYQVQTAPVPPSAHNPAIHADVELVVMRALEKGRETRQQKASQLAQELIAAATLAFKTGFTTLPSVPVPAPDVVPEFGAAEEDDAKASSKLDEESIVEPTPKAGKKTKRPRSKKKAEILIENNARTESPDIQPPVSMPDTVLIEVTEGMHETQLAELVEVAPNATLVGATETQTDEPPVDVPGDALAASLVEVKDAEAESPLMSEPAFAVAAKTEVVTETYVQHPFIEELVAENNAPADVDDDLTLVFGDAELRLDEIFPDEKSLIDKPKLVEAETVLMPEIPLLISNIKPDEVMAVEENDADAVPTFGNAIAASNNGGKLLILAVAGTITLLIGIVGLGYLFLDLSSPPQMANSQAEPTQNSAPIPVGMALVPGGDFMMGSDSGDELSRLAHKATVKPFYMDITEVTNEEYKKFVDATKHSTPPDWKNRTFPDGKSKFPVTGVNWDDANAYAKWAGKRLPTEEEWEFAARGTNGGSYPWGNEWKSEFANADNQTKGMREVGQGDGKSPFGMSDMVGNAWEWTASDFVGYLDGNRSRQSSGKKVIRGGCFESRPNQATTTFRVGYRARGDDYRNTSFRCVKDIPAPSQ